MYLCVYAGSGSQKIKIFTSPNFLILSSRQSPELFTYSNYGAWVRIHGVNEFYMRLLTEDVFRRIFLAFPTVEYKLV